MVKKTEKRNAIGSAHFLTYSELIKYNNTNINQILAKVPGINLQEEDGFGLRPNIGIRGVGIERTSKISIMEDGILMAPKHHIPHRQLITFLLLEG